MSFRKRRRPTPFYKIPPPFSPMAGDYAELHQSGTSPWCAMMQVAADDTYDDYVICRGFDPRILKFVDYASGDANKPGISVAKPFGKRTTGTYEIGEIYPAFLPTQGHTELNEFKQGPYFPPSPVAVKWRVGQNPGVVTGGLDGGQPENLTDEIGILYDHNGKVVNWLLIDSKAGDDHFLFTLSEDMGATEGLAEIRSMDDATQVEASAEVKNTLGDFSHLKSGERGICVKSGGIYYAVHPEGGGTIEFLVDSATTISDTASPYYGMRELTVTIISPPCNRTSLHLTSAKVYEHDPQCLAGDETDAALEGRKDTAFEGVFQDQSSGASAGDLTPCHWVLQGLCCPPEA